jgi:hypothetical protein
MVLCVKEFTIFQEITMSSSQKDSTKGEGFVPQVHYRFDPPLEVECFAAETKGLFTKRFDEGMCLKFEPKRDAFAFQGTPVGEVGPYFFFVEHGKGSIAKELTPPND